MMYVVSIVFNNINLYYKKILFKVQRKNINNIYDIDELILFLQILTDTNTTSDDLTFQIIEHIKLYDIEESTIIRMSKLHKAYGQDLGIQGFTINIIWSSIVMITTSNVPDSK